MFKRTLKQKGFSLIETMLYVVLAGTMILFMSFFTGMIVDARIKNRTISEVEEQGSYALRIITQSIRNSTAINTPTPGSNTTSLSIKSQNSSLDPIVFDLDNFSLRIKEGTSNPVYLTNSHIAISDLNFQNLSLPGTPGMVRVSFVVTYVNLSGKNEYNFSKTWSTSVSLRDK